MDTESKWKHRGVRVVHANELDINTAQTPGMNRAAAITNARAGAEKLWAGTVIIHPKAKTGAHHHGPVESVIYVVSAAPVCAGATGSNSSRKRDRAISSTCRPTSRTRRSTRAISRSHAYWCAAARIPWW